MPRKIQILTELLFIVYILCRHFFPWHHQIRLPPSPQSRGSPSSPLLLLLTEIPAGRAALPCLSELNPLSIYLFLWDPGTPTHMTKSDPPASADLLQPLIFPIFLSVPSFPYIVNTCWREREA